MSSSDFSIFSLLNHLIPSNSLAPERRPCAFESTRRLVITNASSFGFVRESFSSSFRTRIFAIVSLISQTEIFAEEEYALLLIISVNFLLSPHFIANLCVMDALQISISALSSFSLRNSNIFFSALTVFFLDLSSDANRSARYSTFFEKSSNLFFAVTGFVFFFFVSASSFSSAARNSSSTL